MKSFSSISTALIGTSLIAISPIQASYRKCIFTENTGKTIVQYAEVNGHTGNIILRWDDGGKTHFAVMPDRTYRDEGNNLWVLDFQRVGVGLTRADEATLVCN